jgi:hypothetical protein
MKGERLWESEEGVEEDLKKRGMGEGKDLGENGRKGDREA